MQRDGVQREPVVSGELQVTGQGAWGGGNVRFSKRSLEMRSDANCGGP